MKTIYLSDGKVSQVDDEDYQKVNAVRWSSWKGYAKNAVIGRMHRFILDIPLGDSRIVDHINRNRLDNRKCNLRIVSHKMNCYNSDAEGCSFNTRLQKWEARITVDKQFIYLGLFLDKDIAKSAYLEAKSAWHNGWNDTFISELEVDRIKYKYLNKRTYSSNFKGVSYVKAKDKWRSSLFLNGKSVHLGFYDTDKDAYEARLIGMHVYKA